MGFQYNALSKHGTCCLSILMTDSELIDMSGALYQSRACLPKAGPILDLPVDVTLQGTDLCKVMSLQPGTLPIVSSYCQRHPWWLQF